MSSYRNQVCSVRAPRSFINDGVPSMQAFARGTQLVRPLRLRMHRIPGGYRPAMKVASAAGPILRDLEGAQELAQTLIHKLPRRSRELVEEGVLQDLSKDSGGRLVAPTLAELIKETPHDERRYETVTAFNVLLRHLHVARKCCAVCLYPRARCVCARVQRPAVPRHARIWMLQHYGEYGRGNNSGSLLCMLAGAQRATRGIIEEQEALLSAVEEAHSRDAACVLFPSPDALDAREFVRERAGRELTLVVLDGTGNQARNLQNFMPSHIPRIKLPIGTQLSEGDSGGNVSWLNPVRMQTQSDRVCTAQAVAVVLDIMREHETAKAVEHAVSIVVEDGARARDLFHHSRSLEPIF